MRAKRKKGLETKSGGWGERKRNWVKEKALVEVPKRVSGGKRYPRSKNAEGDIKR